ncbi:MAG: anthranilate synthase component I family protein [Myxococcales bacterium]|nr:anthranilate synthase component I family protein [Myxococcales bacterium]
MRQEVITATPWALMAELAGVPGTVMLHSASNADGVGASTFVASTPWREIFVHGDEARLMQGDEVLELRRGEPALAIERWLADVGVSLHGEARALPWVAGYFGYEFGAQVGAGHKLPRPRGSTWPDAWLGVYTAVCRWEQAGEHGIAYSSRAHGVSPRLAQAMAGATSAPLSSSGWHVPSAPRADERELRPRFDDEGYLAAIASVQRGITAGEVYQVNIARQLIAAWPSADAVALYHALSCASPAPFGGVLQLAAGSIVTNSPELFLRKRAGDVRIETRPIKGTRRRAPAEDATAARDEAAVVNDLLASEKDGAEHDMIVDLERNDLGRICEIGSVRVERHGYPLVLPQLVHRVSQIAGDLRGDVGLAAMLGAMFPGGSITGAPKLAAMQMIAALEPFARGPYCGAIGYLTSGEVSLSVAIRTALLQGGELVVTVGGGIVADSVPAAELEETQTKALGFAAALRGDHVR